MQKARDYVPVQSFSILKHPDLDERWVHDRIKENPSILGLGDLDLKDSERRHAGAGRLDLLLQGKDSTHRFEIEIQLGASDESHIIRTIEYWDIERKRYPHYQHTAVIVAEGITSRFLNVISLFNGTIPLIAIKMSAFQINGGTGLVFTTVLNEVSRGLVDEDEELAPQVNREYWVQQSSESTMAAADEILKIIRSFSPTCELRFNKAYVGITEDGSAHNFVWFHPRKNRLNTSFYLPFLPETTAELEGAGLDLMDYDTVYKAYRVRLTQEDINKNRELLTKMASNSRAESMRE